PHHRDSHSFPTRRSSDLSQPTGTCACLITKKGKNRSLVAYLGASQNFTLQYLQEHFDLVHQSRIVYTSGFFLTVCFEAQLLLARDRKSTRLNSSHVSISY